MGDVSEAELLTMGGWKLSSVGYCKAEGFCMMTSGIRHSLGKGARMSVNLWAACQPQLHLRAGETLLDLSKISTAFS
ncbi:unnamed protein product [Protopolystoma xenopodis]|uniref:Uncharacterized protein n=1 Tax=Protopolystoma xenopodis TaxID=117903 RepID=A0A3S5FFL0_9PLAT|nr:unnamed protein product [Protopolystoma xenopodis]